MAGGSPFINSQTVKLLRLFSPKTTSSKNHSSINKKTIAVNSLEATQNFFGLQRLNPSRTKENSKSATTEADRHCSFINKVISEIRSKSPNKDMSGTIAQNKNLLPLNNVFPKSLTPPSLSFERKFESTPRIK